VARLIGQGQLKPFSKTGQPVCASSGFEFEGDARRGLDLNFDTELASGPCANRSTARQPNFKTPYDADEVERRLAEEARRAGKAQTFLGFRQDRTPEAPTGAEADWVQRAADGIRPCRANG